MIVMSKYSRMDFDLQDFNNLLINRALNVFESKALKKELEFREARFICFSF